MFAHETCMVSGKNKLAIQVPGQRIMKKTISIYLILFSATLHAQSWLWAKSFGSDKLDYGSQATILKDGNILTTGDFVGLYLYLPDSTITGNVNRSAFVAKFDQAGNMQKITICKGAVNGGGDVELGRFAEDEGGNLYMAGSAAGGAWFDTCWIVSGGGGNACIAKFNSDLRCLWAQKHSTGSANGQTLGDVFYSKGNLFNAGFASGLNNYIDTFYVTNPDGNLKGKSFLCRFDTTAKATWVKQTWGGYTVIDIAGLYNDKIYCVGSSDSCFVYDTINICNAPTNLGICNLYVTNSNGNVLWSIVIKGAYGAGIGTASVSSLGDVLFGGSFDSTVIIKGQVYAKTPGASLNSFLAKCDSVGNLKWSKRLSSTNLIFFRGCYLDNLGKAYVSGQFIGIADFGNGVTLTSTFNNKYDMFVARYDANGNCMGAFKQHGVSPTQITQDSAANPIIVGSIYPDSAVLGDIHLVSKGQQDFFIGKLSAITGSSSSKTIEPDGFLNIYANPNAGLFTIQVPQALLGSSMAQLLVYGPSGELIKDEATDTSQSKVSVNLGEVVRGLYTVVLQGSNRRFTGRVVVE